MCILRMRRGEGRDGGGESQRPVDTESSQASLLTVCPATLSASSLSASQGKLWGRHEMNQPSLLVPSFLLSKFLSKCLSPSPSLCPSTPALSLSLWVCHPICRSVGVGLSPCPQLPPRLNHLICCVLVTQPDTVAPPHKVTTLSYRHILMPALGLPDPRPSLAGSKHPPGDSAPTALTNLSCF